MSKLNLNDVGVVILAAGRGTRFKCTNTPKVIHETRGRPMIAHVVDSVSGVGLKNKPVIVINQFPNQVSDFIGNTGEYVVQKEQLGTGHAVATAEPILKGKVDMVVVLYGDMPFIKSESIKRLADLHATQGDCLTLMTVSVADFDGWRGPLYDFGRVVRDTSGKIKRIVEKKDASPEELEITELNTCYYCFKSDWLWDNLKKLKNNNAQGEYYLTDLVEIAISQNKRVESIEIDAREAIGVNTKEHLEMASKI